MALYPGLNTPPPPPALQTRDRTDLRAPPAFFGPKYPGSGQSPGAGHRRAASLASRPRRQGSPAYGLSNQTRIAARSAGSI